MTQILLLTTILPHGKMVGLELNLTEVNMNTGELEQRIHESGKAQPGCRGLPMNDDARSAGPEGVNFNRPANFVSNRYSH